MATQMTTEEIEATGGTYERTNGDAQVAIVRHIPDGEAYAVRYVSVWTDADTCVGVTIADCIGPLHYSEVRRSDGLLHEPSDPEMADVVDALDGGDATDNLDWARAQDWADMIVADEREWAQPDYEGAR